MMSSDPGCNSPTVTLEKYIETRIDEVEKRIGLAETLNHHALDKALETLNARLALMNEFRMQMKDQQSTFATKESVEDLKVSRAVMEGKASQSSANLATLFGVISLVLAVAKWLVDLLK